MYLKLNQKLEFILNYHMQQKHKV